MAKLRITIVESSRRWLGAAYRVLSSNRFLIDSCSFEELKSRLASGLRGLVVLELNEENQGSTCDFLTRLAIDFPKTKVIVCLSQEWPALNDFRIISTEIEARRLLEVFCYECGVLAVLDSTLDIDQVGQIANQMLADSRFTEPTQPNSIEQFITQVLQS
jgi:hypothetical protein